MAEERFRLTAEIQDQFSAPLGRMKRMLGDIKPTPEMKAVRAELDGLQATVAKINRIGAGGGTDIVGGLGFNLSAAAGIAAVANSMRNLATQSLELRHVSRETGLAANDLRALQKAGERFQIAPDAVIQGTQVFADRLALLRRGLGEAAGELRQKAPGIFGQLQGSTNNMDALDKYLSFLGKIKDPQVQKQYADLLGLGGMTRMFTDGPEAAAKAFQAAREKIGKEGDFGEQAKRMADAMRDLNDQLDKIERMVAPQVFKDMADFAKSTVTDIENIQKIYNAIKGYFDGTSAAQAKTEPGIQKKIDQTTEQRVLLKDVLSEATANGEKGRVAQLNEALRLNSQKLEALQEELRKAREAGGATVQQQSYSGSGSGLAALIQKAGYGGGGFGGGSGGGGLFPRGVDYGAMRDAYNNSSAGRVQRALRGEDSGGGGGSRGGSRGGSMPGIPDNVPMSDAERNTLGLIMKYESHGQNKMNYVGERQGLDPQTAKGYTAQGYFQMLNSNWRRIAPGLGIKVPNAMSGSLEEQTRVALHLLRHGGIGNWANYNPALRAAIGRGEHAPAGSVPNLQAEQSGVPWHQRSRSMEPGRMSRLRDDEVKGPGSALAPGDEGMLDRARRAGLMGGSQRIDGSIGATVTFMNPPAGMGVSVKHGGVVEEVKVNRGHSLANQGV